MYTEVLSRLAESKTSKGEPGGALEGIFNFQGKEVSVCLDPDDEDLDVTKRLAEKILSNLGEYEAKAKAKLFEAMFDQYNENWRQDDEPILSKEEFLQNLALAHIWFLGSDSVDFMYSDGGMFGGHSLIPQSFDGETFTYVQMYG